MSYRDDALRLPNGMSVAMIKAGAAGIAARADARIAELEREIERLDAQWREELRIYRETDGGDAERYRYIASLMRGEPELMGDAYGFRWVLPGGILSERMTLAAAIDAARANGGAS